MQNITENALIVHELTASSFRALAQNKIHAIRVKDFYPIELAHEISNRMLDSQLYGKYENAPLIGRVGQALYETSSSHQSRERYWQHAQEWTRQMREVCNPYLTPIDKLRLELDEVWPSGATQGIVDGKRMFVGLARVFSPGSSAEPHQDVLAWDLPNNPMAMGLKSQIAANIYLRMPEKGGKLILWPCELTMEEYNQIQNPGSYGLDRAKLPAPYAEITPQEGELILFNSRRVHAVEPPERDSRVTWACFIGQRQQANQPLIMWS